MDSESAFKILGLVHGASPFEIEEAFQRKSQIVTDRINAAPSDKVRAESQAELANLKAARQAAYTALGKVKPTETSSVSLLKAADINIEYLPSAVPNKKAGEPSRASQATSTALPASQLRQTGPTTTTARLEIGRNLAGRFIVTALIADMESGAVYEVMDNETSERFGIKTVSSKYVAEGGGFEAFKEQAEIMSGLIHPNVLQIYDFVRDGDTCFFVIELLEGETLRAVMDRRKAARKPFTLESTESIRTGLIEGLAYEHSTTFNLDIKPQNIWVFTNGTIKIMDFGFGRVMAVPPGSVEYMAPEQATNPNEATASSDQYSAAAILFEMLTGRIPGEAGRTKSMPGEIPLFVSRALQRALSTNPKLRHASMHAFASAVNLGVKATNKRMAFAAAIFLTVLMLLTYPMWSSVLGENRWLAEHFTKRSYYSALKSGDAALRKKDYLEAEKFYQRANKEWPQNREGEDKLNESKVRGLVARGDQALAKKEFDDARKFFRDALQVNENDAEAKEKMLLTTFIYQMAEGERAYKTGHFEEAERSFAGALKLKPNDIGAKDKLAETQFAKFKAEGDRHLREGRFDQALTAFGEANKLREHDQAVANAVKTLKVQWFKKCVEDIESNMNAKRWDKALQICDTALAVKRDSAKVLNYKLGIEAYLKGKMDQAINFWTKAQKEQQ